MTDDRLNELLNGYLDQTLSEEEGRELKQHLVSSAEARKLFWEYAHHHALTRELLAEAPAQRQALEFPVTASRPSAWRRFTALAAAACLLLGLGVFLWMRGPQAPLPPWAVVLQLPQDAAIERKDPARPPRSEAGLLVYAGDVIRTGDAPGAALQTPDGSRLDLSHQTTCTLGSGDPTRRVALGEGEVAFQITPQPVGRAFSVETAHGVVTVKGTRFTVVANEQSTRVNVQEGRVEVLNRQAGGTVQVEAGTFAILGMTRTLHGKQLRTEGLTLEDYQDAEPLVIDDFESGLLDHWQWTRMQQKGGSWTASEIRTGSSTQVCVQDAAVRGRLSKALLVNVPTGETQNVVVNLHAPLRASTISVKCDVRSSLGARCGMTVYAFRADRQAKVFYQDPDQGARLARLNQTNGGYHNRMEYLPTIDERGEKCLEVKNYIDGQLAVHSRLYATSFGCGVALQEGTIYMDNFVVREMIPKRSTMETP